MHPDVTRLVIVGPEGKILEKWHLYPDGVEVHVQDEGSTLKVFPRRVTT